MSSLILPCVIQRGINVYASMVSHFVMLIYVQINVYAPMVPSVTKSTVNQHGQSTFKNQHSIFSGTIHPRLNTDVRVVVSRI